MAVSTFGALFNFLPDIIPSIIAALDPGLICLQLFRNFFSRLCCHV